MKQFKEGEESDILCSKCNVKMIFEMSFQDRFSYETGHYTTDLPIVFCPSCDQTEAYYDYYAEGDEEDDNF